MGGFYCRQQTFCTDWRGDQGTQAALAALATAWLALVVGLFGFMSHTPFVVMFIVFPGALAWLHQARPPRRHSAKCLQTPFCLFDLLPSGLNFCFSTVFIMCSRRGRHPPREPSVSQGHATPDDFVGRRWPASMSAAHTGTLAAPPRAPVTETRAAGWRWRRAAGASACRAEAPAPCPWQGP